MTVFFCVAVFGISLSALISLFSGNDFLKTLVITQMKFNTAVALIAGAMALLLASKQPLTKLRERWGKFFASLTLVLGALSLLEYFTGFKLGIDEIFVGDSGQHLPNFPGLMAPNSAFCFLILGLSLFVMDGKRWLNRLAQGLAMVSGCVGIFAVFGYLFEAQGLYKLASFIRMTLVTSVCISLLSAGILLARPQYGVVRLLLRKNLSGIFSRRMMLAACILPPLFCWLGMVAELKGYFLTTTAWAVASLAMILLFTSFVWLSGEAMNESEAAMDESELRFRTLSNSIPQLAWMTDASGHVSWYNQRWYDYTGYGFQEMKALGWEVIHNPELVAGTTAKWQASLRDGTPWEDVLQLKGKDGNYRWFLSRAMPLKNENGDIVCWFGSNTDIEDQRRTEKALRESEQRYATLTSAIPQLVWTCLKDGRCNYLSRQWVEYTGIPEKEQLNYAWLDKVIHPEDRDRTLKHWMGAVDGLHPYDIEYRIRRYDGQFRWFKVRGTAMNDEGEIKYWVGTCTDVHEQRLISEELKRAKQAAEKANHAKTLFLANMSHEIRTPLGAITGFVHLLKISADSAQTRDQYIQVIEKNSKHLLSLVDDILDLSKIETGHINVKSAIFNLPQFLGDFLSSMEFRAREKKIAFQITYADQLPETICTDQFRLQQILANIVGNAIKFTDQGRIGVILRYQEKILSVEITDTGIGISSESVSKLFRPFSQADETFTRKFGGSGLGLALSKRLCQFLGGDLVLKESVLGHGSTFVITLRNHDETIESSLGAQIAMESQTSNVLAGHENRGKLQGFRVLLVEDVADNRVLVSAYLKKTGAKITFAENGHQGLELALQEQPDIVLMDMQMPIMGGHEAIQRLRSLGFKNPIIAVTAHAMISEREKCFQSGCNDYLTKPLERHVLIESLETLLLGSKQAEAVSGHPQTVYDE